MAVSWTPIVRSDVLHAIREAPTGLKTKTKTKTKTKRCCKCSVSKCVSTLCVCAREGRRCVDCLCNEHGRCRNQPLLGTSSSQPLPSAVPSAVNADSVTSSPVSSPLSCPSSSSILPSSSSSTVERTSSSQPQVQTAPQILSQVVTPSAEPGAPDSETQASQINPDSGVTSAERTAEEEEHTRGRSLPSYVSANELNYTWGTLSGADFGHVIESIYEEAVHWRRNVFQLPSGEVGKSFITELARLFQAYAEGTGLESVTLTAAMVLPLLLLQKPHGQSKAKDHVACLSRRMKAWKDGDIEGLAKECRVIQTHLQTGKGLAGNDDGRLRGFTKMMLHGNIRGALRVIANSSSGGVLPLSDTMTGSDGIQRSVHDILKEKHPPGAAATPASIIDESEATESLPFHPVVFEKITGSQIRSAALRTEGAAGPSGIDAAGWRRMCTSFHGASNTLCSAVAAVTRRLCTTYVDPTPLSALIACRLIPLDKRPGVRPIGVCETVRRIMGKAIVHVVNRHVRSAVGPLQLCSGQPAGSEAAIHAMSDIFNDAESDGVLLVDASNAFNLVNRRAALLNVQFLCPTLAPFLTNIYRTKARLFVGGETLLSQEGTTQGDPLAMAMFAIAIRPLIDRASQCDALHVWFADDAAGGGRISALRQWWDLLKEHGPSFGYHVNAAKTWLLVKPEKESAAASTFEGTGINITIRGVVHLGAPLGDSAYAEEVIKQKVAVWVEELSTLANFGLAQPHLAFCALTQGLLGKWTYLSRTTEVIGTLLQPLEDILHQRFLPAITGKDQAAPTMRALMGLPSRLGGLGVINPIEVSAAEYITSQTVCRDIVSMITSQREPGLSARMEPALCAQRGATNAARKAKQEGQNAKCNDVCSALSPELQQAVRLAQESGASTWLSTRPIEEHGFALHKGAFRDALALRYGWEPANMPTHCACGESFDSSHALSCPKGGFIIARHNELRDLTAGLLDEVCHDVEIEPRLQPLSGEAFVHRSAIRDAEARLDIKARGLWGGRFECTFFDVRIFNPSARSNRAPDMASVYRRHERVKRRAYDQRVRDVEMASFVPLVFATTGGFGPAATTAFKRIAARLSDKWNLSYSAVMGWLRCRISFALQRSAIMCLRGSRQHVRSARVQHPELAMAEARIRAATRD